MVALVITPPDPNDRGKVGLDFIAFYTAGRFVREGKTNDLYDIHKVQVFQKELARQNGVDLGSAVGPWWNPPFYAWVFVPLAHLSYRPAIAVWVWFNVGCAAVAVALLCRLMIQNIRRPALLTLESNPDASLPSMDWRTWALLPVLTLMSVPFIHALSHGQNTCTSLLIITVGVLFWRKGYALLAGMILGLMFYKPQLAAVISVILVLNLGFRALAGLAVTGVVLLAASLALPGSIDHFLHQMPRNLHLVQCEVTYLWDRHVTFKAFWRLLLQGSRAGDPKWYVSGLSGICSGAVGLYLIRAALRLRRDSAAATETHSTETSIRRDRLIAATIAATPMIVPFYFDYDQLLLAIPAVLFACDFMRENPAAPHPASIRWLLRSLASAVRVAAAQSRSRDRNPRKSWRAAAGVRGVSSDYAR